MTVSDDVLAGLRRAFEGRPVPRVRALHLPVVPGARTKDAEFGAIELDDGSLGLSYLLLDGHADALAGGRPAGGDGLSGTDALDLAGRWAGGTGAARALGFAAVNALTRHLFDRAGFVPPDAADSIGGLRPVAGEHIGMVGYFPPLVKQVTARGARLTVLELRAELAGDHGDHHVTLDPAALAACTQVLCTSTVLLNDTLDRVLAHCRGAQALAMIGPGAGCLPDSLFARGVTLVGGAWVVDARGLVDALASGGAWGHCTRKFALTPATYPGLDALVAAAR